MSVLKRDIDKCKHPNSRKTIALTRKTKKDKVKEEAKLGQYIKQNIVGEKVLWFKDNLPETESTIYTKNQINALLKKYMCRFDEELEMINLKNSIGGKRNRQHASREDVIKMAKQKEREEYDGCGIEIPDLMNAAQVVLLKNWNGELRFLQKFKLKRYGFRNVV